MDSCKNISELINIAHDSFDNQSTLWFRGHSEYNFKLLPSILREKNNSIDEQATYNEFIRRYPNHSLTHKTSIEWLTLMQHYGMPTRLLDWTSNLLIALYFACEDLNNDGALFVYNTYESYSKPISEFLEFQIFIRDNQDLYDRLLNIIESKEEEYSINELLAKEVKKDILKYYNLIDKPLKRLMKENLMFSKNKIDTKDRLSFTGHDMLNELSNIIQVMPPLLNERLKLQHSFFTFHGGKVINGEKLIDYVPMEEHSDIVKKISKIRIKKEHKKSFLKELSVVGISESTLFPEMEYQVKDIKKLYTSINDE